MRRVIYGGAMSLDGYIAGPNGEYDWIVMDPEIDFKAIAARFDTYLIGRKTFDVMRRMDPAVKSTRGIRNVVFSRTLKQSDFPSVTISDDAEVWSRSCARNPARTSRSSGAASCFEACWPPAWWMVWKSR